jgi:parallel beta-helix repeat protein
MLQAKTINPKRSSMKTRLIHKVVSLPGLALFVLGLLLGPAAPVQAFSDVLYVAPGASCIGTPNCYATVQAAVDLAATGIEIRVAAGTYTDISTRPRNDITTTGDVTQVVYITKTVTIRGGYNTSFDVWDPAVNVTTLNAQNLGRGIYITGNISPTIEGLSITGGDATGLTGYDYYGTHDVGGGVYVMTATATLNNNRIFSNTAPFGGGGVYLGNSTGQLNNNTISSNTVNNGGAGVFLYQGSATLTGNTIISNTSHNNGGGMYLFSTDATLRGNTITGNTTTMYGGGADVASCNPTFSGNIVSGNTAFKGGGLYLWYSHSNLTNNVIVDNQATNTGSGLWIGGSQPNLLHTTIARNTGGDGSGVVITNDGMGTNSTVIMTNTVLVSQAVGITASAGSAATVDGILWFGNGTNTSGAGTIPVSNPFTGDPAFAPDGYHLTVGSAAIDQGVNAGVMIDIDSQPRLGVPDLGADEYWAPGFPKYIYLPLIMRNP